jgi:hypothetical protein
MTKEEAFGQQLGRVVSAARSVDDVRSWLEQYNDVLDVMVRDHLVKTNPPQVEIEVRLRRPGREESMIIDVLCLPTGRFQLGMIHAAN